MNVSQVSTNNTSIINVKTVTAYSTPDAINAHIYSTKSAIAWSRQSDISIITLIYKIIMINSNMKWLHLDKWFQSIYKSYLN